MITLFLWKLIKRKSKQTKPFQALALSTKKEEEKNLLPANKAFTKLYNFTVNNKLLISNEFKTKKKFLKYCIEAHKTSGKVLFLFFVFYFPGQTFFSAVACV